MTAKLKRGITKVKDPGSALTHFIAMILAIIAAIPLLSKAGHDSGPVSYTHLDVYKRQMKTWTQRPRKSWADTGPLLSLAWTAATENLEKKIMPMYRCCAPSTGILVKYALYHYTAIHF